MRGSLAHVIEGWRFALVELVLVELVLGSGLCSFAIDVDLPFRGGPDAFLSWGQAFALSQSTRIFHSEEVRPATSLLEVES